MPKVLTTARAMPATAIQGDKVIISFGRLWNWLRRSPSLSHLHVCLYTRRNCHLCDSAWKHLEARQRRFGFQLEAVDVDDDPKLVASFGEDVPVVTINGTVRFRGAVNDLLLMRLLRAESNRPSHRRSSK
jgi:glutaredoxin